MTWDCYQKLRTRYKKEQHLPQSGNSKKLEKIRPSENRYGFLRAKGIKPLNYFEEIIKMPNKASRIDLRL